MMQVMELFFGLATSCGAAYHAYMYATIPSQHHKKATSWTRAVLLVGKMGSNISAQVVVWWTGSNYR